MLLYNKWLGGKTQFQIPHLPPEYREVSGALFQRIVFDKKMGKEIALILLDDPQFTFRLGSLNPFGLRATTGIVRTSAGIIAYIVWTIYSSHGHIVDYEHLLNPFDIGTIHLISGIAQQAHFKVLIVDSHNSLVVGWYEVDNNYNFGKLAAGIVQAVGNESVADFAATKAALFAEFSLEDMKGSLR